MSDEQSIAESTALAKQLLASNPGKRFAVSTTGSGVALWDASQDRFVPIYERTLFGTFVEGGVENPARQWVEVESDEPRNAGWDVSEREEDSLDLGPDDRDEDDEPDPYLRPVRDEGGAILGWE